VKLQGRYIIVRERVTIENCVVSQRQCGSYRF